MIAPIGKYAPKLEDLIKSKSIKNMRKIMRKSDLENDMIIKTRNGCKKLVIRTNDKIVFSGISTYFFASALDDSLRNKNKNPELDIMKVYRISEPAELSVILNDDSDYNLTLIWERPEVVEVTMQEVADKLGIPVENLRIKE